MIKCSFCGEKALYDTVTLNNYLCESNECKVAYCEEIITRLDDEEEE